MTDVDNGITAETHDDDGQNQPAAKKRKTKSAFKNDDELDVVLSSINGTGDSTSAQNLDADKKIKDYENKLLKRIGDNGDQETRAAREEEEERLKRVNEAAKLHFDQIMQQRQQQLDIQNQPKYEIEDFDDLICLSSDDDDEEEVEGEDSGIQTKEEPNGFNHQVIDIDSDEEVSQPPNTDDAEEFDINTCGVHANDELNISDMEGRVLINVGHPPEDADVYLSDELTRMIKPHQIGGVRFMYDNIVETQTKFKTSSGVGCILAHSMGLGKTFSDNFVH